MEILQFFATFANQVAFLAFLVDQHTNVNAAQLTIHLKMLDLDIHRIGQFLTQIAEQFFTHDFRCQKRLLRSVIISSGYSGGDSGR